MNYKNTFLAMTIGFALSSPADSLAAPTAPSDEYFNGHKLLKICTPVFKDQQSHLMAKGYCMGYISGVSQVASLSYTIGYKIGSSGAQARERDWCIPESANLTDEIKAVLDYLYAHPDQLGKHQSVLVYRALRSAFPCENRPE